MQIDRERMEIPGYEGFYEIDCLGNIYSIERTVASKCRWGKMSTRKFPAKLLSQQMNRTGYYAVSLYKNGARKRHEVHRLVCRAFHGEPPTPNMQAAHRDGVRTNNSANNLRWLSVSDNALERRDHGTITRPMAIVTKNQAIEIREMYATGKYLQREIGDIFGIKQAAVSAIVLNKNWKPTAMIDAAEGVSHG